MSLSTAALHLPDGHARQLLNAHLQASGMAVTRLPSADVLNALVEQIHDPCTVAVVDLGHDLKLPDINQALPHAAWRARVLLTRLTHGHVSLSEQRWVRSLGYAGLWGEFDTDDVQGDLRNALAAVHHALNLAPPNSTLPTFKPSEARNAPARTLIRRLTGAPAEVAASVLRRRLPIGERTYLLRSYPACFIGREGISAMARHHNITREEALALGQALHSLGLVVHVTHSHDLSDSDYFYRVALSRRADAVDLGAAAAVLHEALPGARSDTWAGAVIVDVLSARFELARHEAWVIAQRLTRLDVLAHNTQNHRTFSDDPQLFKLHPATLALAQAAAPTTRQPPKALLPAW